MIRIVHDQWLSQILEKPAFSLHNSFDQLSKEDLPNGVAFLGAKVPSSDVTGLLNMQRLNFKVIDTNVQLFQSYLDRSAKYPNIRFAVQRDELEVRYLARNTFKYNRFHQDPCIPNDIASRIKEEWVGNYFKGRRGEWMVVAEDKNKVAGFLQLLRKDNTLIIDLIAVDKDCRGKGIAKAMISFASKNCVNKLSGIQVGTQIANTASLSLYTSLGFHIISAAYVLHLHQQG